MNERATELLGRPLRHVLLIEDTTAAELLATTFIEFVHPDDRQATLAVSEAVAGGNALGAFENRYRCKDGSYRHFQWSITPAVEEQVKYGVARDVTERKRTELALRASEEYFRFIDELVETTRTLTDPAQIMAVMARMLGEHLHASRCAYADVEQDGEQFTIQHDYTDGCPSTVGRYHLSLFGARAVATLGSGQTLIIRNVATELLPGDGADMFNAIGINAIVTCPLIKDGRLRAMMAVHQTTARDWKPGEIALVEDVVERCWATIERRTAEERLRSSEGFLERTAKIAGLGGWEFDLRIQVLTWSAQTCRIHDLEPGYALQASEAFSFYPPQARLIQERAMTQAMEHGVGWDHELPLITATGRAVWVRTIASVELQDGHPIRISGVLQDITARKGAEEALFKANALQSAIFNSANFSCIATDAQGVIQIFNVGAERMLGYTAAEAVNTLTAADLHDRQEVIARAAGLSAEFGTPIAPGFEALVFKAAHGIEDIYELTKIRKDGSGFPAAVSVTALRDAQEAIIGYLLIGTDNTARQEVEKERKKLDQRLRDQQFYTRSLIESNIDALMTTDLHGIITDVNKQTETLTGCTRDELIGAPFKNHFTDPRLAEAGIQQVLTEGKVTNYELTARARDGTQTVVSYNATTFHDRERTLKGVFASARDMTELKRYERTVQQNEIQRERDAAHAKELAVVNHELEAFSYSVSHDLRAPLRHIHGYVEMLRGVTTGQLSDQAQHYLTTITDASAEMGELIDDLLAFSRVGRAEIRGRSVALGELVHDVIRRLEMATKGRHIVWHIAPLPTVIGDDALIKQVLTNLIDNAIKYSRTRDPATIEIGYSGEDTGRAILFVRDNGVGFDMRYADKLFGVFQRLHRAEEFEGTGIGLATVRRIIGRHGGRVWAEGTLNEGATFYVTLELAPSSEEVTA